MSDQDKRLGVYFHIPFCASKCAYCDFLQSAGQGQAHALLPGCAAHSIAGNDAPHDRLLHRHGVLRRRHAELLRRAAHRGDIAGAEGHEPADEAERDHRGVQPGQRPAQGAAHAAQGGRGTAFPSARRAPTTTFSGSSAAATTGGRWKWRSSARARPASAT